MISLLEAAKVIQKFERTSLAERILSIENILAGGDSNICNSVYPSLGITSSLLESVITLKRAPDQINFLVHSIGVLHALPKLLGSDEVVQYLSLGAGNSDRPFDLETNERIAEFNFSDWQDGAESIRQNSFFKDFFLLAEHENKKQKYLYVLETKEPLNFLTSEHSLESIMKRRNKLWVAFQKQYGNQFKKVGEYFEYRKSLVQLIDITEIIPEFGAFFENDDLE